MLTLRLGRGISLTALTALFHLFSLLLTCSVAFAQFPIAKPGTEGLEVIVSGTGPVIAIYQGNSATYSNDLYLVAQPGTVGDTFVFNNHETQVGSTRNLGTFPVGTKLIFRLHVRDTGRDYFTGTFIRNPDNKPHARAQADWKPNETLVSFEDLFNGPFDYNDLSFSFVPTTATPTITVLSTAGWQQTPLFLQLGEQYQISYLTGGWTVDRRSFSYVGPSGYTPAEDSRIFQGCKTVSSLPYGTLLGKIGNGPIFFAGYAGFGVGQFTAQVSGPLYLRINDNEACHGDNDGQITMGFP